MSILSGPEIRRQMTLGAIVIRPEPVVIGPNSVDVRIGHKLYRYRHGALDPDHPDTCEIEKVPAYSRAFKGVADPAWLLLPGVLYLAATLEYTEAHGFVPQVDTRSSWARVGLSVHPSAGRGDDGFCGHWTLELTVVHMLYLRPGDRIAQLTYHTIEGERAPYVGRYQGATSAEVIKGGGR